MNSFEDFKEKLDNEHKWPTTYMFKFVVPSNKIDELKEILQKEPIIVKNSKNRKYASITLKKHIEYSDEVIEIYLKVRKIEGLIAL